MWALKFFYDFFEEFWGRSTGRSNDFYDFFKEFWGRSTGRSNEGAGVWNFKPFEIQSGILYKLFDPVFRVA